MNPSHYLPRALPKELERLVPLALDLRWSWNHDADDLWRVIDERLWDASQNPWLILEMVSARRLQALARDEVFLRRLSAVVEERHAYLRRKTWRESSASDLGRVAFFSMEFALSEALPLYWVGPLVGSGGGVLYEAVVPADRPASDYTPRALPYHGDAVLPIEAPLVVWAR